MHEKKRRSDRVQMAVPIRVRGMSTANKFFDEESATDWVSKHGVMIHLHNLVELESEIHLICLKSMVGGNFRVVWINTRGREGVYNLGLELVDADGDLWGIHFPPTEPEDDESAPCVWLQCQRCRRSEETRVPEAEAEYLSDGFLIAKACEHCKATTAWEYAVETEILPAGEAEGAPAPKAVQKDLRGRGRVPMKTKIKVIRQRFGTAVEDVCETTNVSRGGACFLTSAIYEVGEKINVVVPYNEGDVVIPVPARVVRTEFMKEGYLRVVAVQMEKA